MIDMTNRRSVLNPIILGKIRKYGYGIMASPLFEEAMEQTHHVRTTVGDHSIGVAYFGLMFCALLIHIGIKVNEQEVVRAALLHDLGIVGRDNKFHNNYQCCIQHPIDSLAIAEELVPDLDDVERDSIRYHMFPLMCRNPHHAVGWIITVADKVSQMQDMLAPRSHADLVNRSADESAQSA